MTKLYLNDESNYTLAKGDWEKTLIAGNYEPTYMGDKVCIVNVNTQSIVLDWTTVTDIYSDANGTTKYADLATFKSTFSDFFRKASGDGGTGLTDTQLSNLTANTVARHTHDNKTDVLDELTSEDLVNIQGIDQTYTSTEKTKLAGIEDEATANSSDEDLLNCDNHTSGDNNSVFTVAEKSKLNNLTDSFKGVFADNAAALAAYPSPSAGWCYWNTSTLTIWSVSGGTWVDTTASSVGDMLAAMYDPQAIAADVFDRTNHTGTQAISTIDGLRDELDSKASADDITPGGVTVVGIFDAGTTMASQTTEGYYIWTATPSDYSTYFATGVLKDIWYYNGSEWSTYLSYLNSPSTVYNTDENVSYAKTAGGWETLDSVTVDGRVLDFAKITTSSIDLSTASGTTPTVFQIPISGISGAQGDISVDTSAYTVTLKAGRKYNIYFAPYFNQGVLGTKTYLALYCAFKVGSGTLIASNYLIASDGTISAPSGLQTVYTPSVDTTLYVEINTEIYTQSCHIEGSRCQFYVEEIPSKAVHVLPTNYLELNNDALANSVPQGQSDGTATFTQSPVLGGDLTVNGVVDASAFVGRTSSSDSGYIGEIITAAVTETLSSNTLPTNGDSSNGYYSTKMTLTPGVWLIFGNMFLDTSSTRTGWHKAKISTGQGDVAYSRYSGQVVLYGENDGTIYCPPIAKVVTSSTDYYFNYAFELAATGSAYVYMQAVRIA